MPTQVHHRQPLAGQTLDVPGVGAVSVTLMLRCALFNYNRARLKNTTPNPPAFFQALAQAVREGVARGPWRLPTLAEALAWHAAAK